MTVRTLIGIAVFLTASTANAGELLTNGGFESTTLSGWAISDSAGSGGSFWAVNVPVTPLNGNPTVGAQSGAWYAVSDAFAPGSHALTQTFTTPIGTTNALLTFSIFVNDQFGGSGLGGQVDLLAAGADPLLGSPLHVFYGPADSAVVGGAPNPYVNTVNLNITAFLIPGTSYQLRVLASDSTGPINVGADSFSLIATNSNVPEPNMFIPTALLAGVFAFRARRSRTGRS